MGWCWQKHDISSSYSGIGVQYHALIANLCFSISVGGGEMGMSQVAEANRPLLFLNPQGQFRDSGGGGTRLLHLSRDSQLSRALASGHSPTRIAFASRRGASSSPLVFLVLLRCVALLIAGQLSCLIAATISYTYTNSSVSLVFPSVFRLRRSHLSSLRSLSTLLRSSPWQRHRWTFSS